MVVNGLKDSEHVNLKTMWNLPETLGWGGFEGAWQALGPNMLNSVFMVVPATILYSLLGSINGYFLSKWKLRFSETIFTIILFGLFIPYQVIWLPLVQFVTGIGLVGRRYAVSLLYW